MLILLCDTAAMSCMLIACKYKTQYQVPNWDADTSTAHFTLQCSVLADVRIVRALPVHLEAERATYQPNSAISLPVKPTEVALLFMAACW